MSFTINLYSGQGTSDSGSTNSLNYNIDWSAMPPHDGEYDVTFSFVSASVTTTVGSIILPVVNWGAIPNAYAPTSTTGATASQPSLALGVIRPNVIGAGGQLFSDRTSNVPIRITGRPTQNQFRLRIINANSTQNLATFNVAYVMVIRFTAV
jgi:hypothetical protein